MAQAPVTDHVLAYPLRRNFRAQKKLNLHLQCYHLQCFSFARIISSISLGLSTKWLGKF